MEPLRGIPEFRNVDLVRTSVGEITLEAVRSGAAIKKPGARQGQSPTSSLAGDRRRTTAKETEVAVLEESRRIIRFTIEWDYIPFDPNAEEEEPEETESPEEALEEEKGEEPETVKDEGPEEKPEEVEDNGPGGVPDGEGPQ